METRRNFIVVVVGLLPSEAKVEISVFAGICVVQLVFSYRKHRLASHGLHLVFLIVHIPKVSQLLLQTRLLEPLHLLNDFWLAVVGLHREVEVVVQREVPLRGVKAIANLEVHACEAVLWGHARVLDIVHLVVLVVDDQRQLSVDKTT
jgi:hypothetical protein